MRPARSGHGGEKRDDPVALQSLITRVYVHAGTLTEAPVIAADRLAGRRPDRRWGRTAR
jgi:hypothetical protein